MRLIASYTKLPLNAIGTTFVGALGVCHTHTHTHTHTQTTHAGRSNERCVVILLSFFPSYPSPLNYYNFPKSVCTSVNEVICHGIPDYREIEDGDIVNLDISVYDAGGFHGDLNETFCVGNVDSDGRRVVQTSFECLQAAMELVKPGTLYRDLGNTIEKVAKQNRCSVVRTYCGHGIGSLFHTIPNVPHYAKNKAKGTMKVGHVFTIEPMINLGHSADKTWEDNWTAVTTDGKRSAQFEHTILVTDTGYDILTARENEPVMKWNPDLINR